MLFKWDLDSPVPANLNLPREGLSYIKGYMFYNGEMQSIKYPFSSKMIF